MMVCSIAFSIDTSRPGVNCNIWVACRASAVPRGSITMSLAPRSAAFLKSRGNGVVFGRIGADHDDHIRVLGSHEGSRHRSGADAFQEARDGDAWQSLVQ